MDNDIFIHWYFRESGTVFQTAALFFAINPETSSRVTLASLGTVFQTDLSYCSLIVLLIANTNNQTTKQQDH